MKHEYAQAFLASLESGMSISKALTGLKSALEKRHHLKLLGAVLLESLRVLESGKGNVQAVVAVANHADATHYKAAIKTVLKKLGVDKDTQVIETIDETLVGGFVATYDFKEHDQSYKKALKSLYESIVK